MQLKRQSSIFKEKEISVTSKKWLTIQRYLESVSDDLEEASNERNKLISRVNDLCALLKLNNEEFAPIQEVESWLGALNVINKIRKNQDINSNGMQEISFIKGDGDIYNGFKTILSMDNQKVQSLVKYLITILVKSNAKRRGFIAWDWNNIEKVLNFFESNKNLNIDTSDLYERILDTIANTSKQVFSSEMIRFILKSTDEERYNRTPRKTRMVNSLRSYLKHMDGMNGIGNIQEHYIHGCSVHLRMTINLEFHTRINFNSTLWLEIGKMTKIHKRLVIWRHFVNYQVMLVKNYK